MNAKTIIYLHIPKTGGRSLQNILLRRYSGDEAVVDAHNKLDEIADWPEERKRNIRYLQGHIMYGAHRMLPQECSYITTLREPIDRVISHYYFIKRNTSHALNRVVREQAIGLEDYVTSGVCDEVSNDQARLIAGVARDSSVDTDDILKMAKENIDRKFIVAGIVEQFDETLMLLKRRLGLRNIFYGVRNQTIGRPLKDQIPERTLDLIRERNYADIALYEHAKERLMEIIEGEGAEFSNDIKRFRLINRPYSDMFYLLRNVKNRITSHWKTD
jgi:hypothetical protein